ncbi:hypothetical protein RvY_18481 [Ramazzottius varieornatus]|uniref:Uncharacterized protein n=1 Tax=Ramazzottius varieornatus TaxID=947166 RepID=A0A1D1WBB0_RAMVA|nr:hypothetical protein RvY_18481 [Ramazzottius varieornatus]
MSLSEIDQDVQMGFRRSCRHGVNYTQRRMTEFFALSSSLMIFSRNPVLSAPLKVSWYSVDNTVQRTPNEPGRLRYNGTRLGDGQQGTWVNVCPIRLPCAAYLVPPGYQLVPAPLQTFGDGGQGTWANICPIELPCAGYLVPPSYQLMLAPVLASPSSSAPSSTLQPTSKKELTLSERHVEPTERQF